MPLRELPNEYTMIAGILCGGLLEKGYPNISKDYDFFDVKAIAENILFVAGIRDYEIKKAKYVINRAKARFSYRDTLLKWDLSRELPDKFHYLSGSLIFLNLFYP